MTQATYDQASEVWSPIGKQLKGFWHFSLLTENSTTVDMAMSIQYTSFFPVCQYPLMKWTAV